MKEYIVVHERQVVYRGQDFVMAKKLATERRAEVITATYEYPSNREVGHTGITERQLERWLGAVDDRR